MTVATGAFVYRNAFLSVEGTEYENQVYKARLVPDTPIQAQRTLVPDGEVVDVDSTSWELELTGLQINVAGGLAKYLRESTPGTELDIVLAPQNEVGKPSATFVVLSMPTEFGGEQGNFAPIDITLKVKGAPVFGTL
jgi:hypothetical protein